MVMGAAVKLTPPDHTPAAFRQAAAACVNSNGARRMLALAIVSEGGSRADAARLCGMDRQTLRDWVHRYNELGLDCLSDKAGRRGPKPRLSTDEAQLVAEMVRKGPDLGEDGVVRWRRIDLARSIEARFGVRLAERTVGKILRGLGFRRLSARPQHPKQDEAAQETHKKTLPTWSRPASPSTRAANQSKSGSKMKPGSGSKAA
jgi:transposase